MYEPHPYDRDVSAARSDARHALEISAGVRSQSVSVPCSYMPGDGVNVTRIGAPHSPATVISLQVVAGPTAAHTFLTANTARRLAAHLLNFADDLDEPTHVDIVDRSKGGEL